MRQYSIIDVVKVVVGGAACIGIFLIFFNQHTIIKRIAHVERNIGVSQPSAGASHELQELVCHEPWANVQLQSKDTVVQVFSQIAEVDLMQPYKIGSQGQSFGSGFLINDTGEIVTNAHVIINAQSVWVQMPSLGKQIIDVEVVGLCPDRDLALLRITPASYKVIHDTLGKIPFLRLGDSDKVYRADEVLALGYPLAQHSLKSTTGVVSGREHISTQHYIQISAPINPGSSGGPSVNHKGEVIGINTGYIQGAQNAGYLIPINELKITLEDMHNIKLLRKPFLGLLYIPGSDNLAQFLGNPKPSGCYAVEVYKDGLLDKAGVCSGDMIYEIDGHVIDQFGELKMSWSEDRIPLADYVSRLKLGHKVVLTVYRNGTKKKINVMLNLPELLPVRLVYPVYEKMDYEIIAGMIITPLTLNHVATLISGVPELMKYTKTKYQQEPALVVTHLFPDSQATRSRCITVGSIITEMNNTKVKTLDDVRSTLKQSVKEEFVTVKTSNKVFVVFPREKVMRETEQLSKIYHYPLSPTMMELISALNSHQKT